MTEVFLRIFNMSLSAGILALAVMLARCLLSKKAPKRLFPILWGLVGIRLVLPFTFKSVLSLLPSAEVVPPEILTSDAPALHTGIVMIDVSSEAVMAPLAPTVEDSANPLQIWGAVAAAVWIAGVIGMLLYAVISVLLLRRRMRDAVLLDGNVYLSDRTNSPFVLGMAKPRVYIPFTLRDRDLPFVLAHERAHIARRDHWIKPAAFLLLAVYWFHPILWLAYILLCRDVELACDERVVKNYTPLERADYSEALLACSVTRRAIAACPVAFGEVGVKTRVRTVLNYRRPAFWATVLSVIAVAVLAVCFLTDPVSAAIKNPAVGDYEAGADGIVGSVDTAAFEEISPDFAIGADAYGVAVFKNPRRAWETFQKLYADDLEALEVLHGLKPLSAKNRDMYLIYGAETEGPNPETTARYRFIAKFLDIYDNSFTDHSGLTAKPGTAQSDVLMPSADIPYEVLALAMKRAAARSVKITKESALVLYYSGETHYVFPTGEGKKPVVVLNTEADVVGYNGTSYELRNVRINMPSLDQEYTMLSSVYNRIRNECIDRLGHSIPSTLHPELTATIDSIDEVARIDPEPGMIGVGFLVRYRFLIPDAYADRIPASCEPLGDGWFEAPLLYGMSLYYSLGTGYVMSRCDTIPTDQLAKDPSDDVYLSLLEEFSRESAEEILRSALEAEKLRVEEEYRHRGGDIPTEYTDNCDPNERRRQIFTHYLTAQSNLVKNLQMELQGAIDFLPIRAEVSELTLCGIRDKVTVRDGPEYHWYEVALFKADYRLKLENPADAIDMPKFGLKLDGDSLVPEDGPILFLMISEIDQNGNYTLRYAFEEIEDYRAGHLYDFSPAGKPDLNSGNVNTAVVELVREYEANH
ncbi:MAG: hypothetical protein II889_12275 [Clostridia bacterium]|nr:hypothetical protein [Clostridia bacterium]